MQPAPQYTDVEPQYPYWLQQFPKVDPWHVWPNSAPHRAFVATFNVETGEAAEAVEALETVDAGAAAELHTFAGVD